mgnify:CR=1 FL=1
MILCCGEALIDMIPRPTIAGPSGFVPHAGGAVFNTAIALGRLGVETSMLTGLSTDLFGAVLDDALVQSHVNTALCIRSDRPTTLAFVRLEGGQATYTFYDENSAGRMLDEADLPKIPEAVNALFFGGISLAVEPCAEVYADLLASQADRRLIMLDPNIRPGFIRDEKRYRARLDRMLRDADMVKVSDEDLDWILPGERSHRDKVAELHQHGISVVVVTRGADGASAYTASGLQVEVTGQKVDVVDTVGAGDTFNAGVLASLQDAGQLTKTAIAEITEETLTKALEFGAKTAAVTVSRAGANPPWRAELSTP